MRNTVSYVFDGRLFSTRASKASRLLEAPGICAASMHRLLGTGERLLLLCSPILQLDMSQQCGPPRRDACPLPYTCLAHPANAAARPWNPDHPGIKVSTVPNVNLNIAGPCPTDSVAMLVGQSMVASVPAGSTGTFEYEGCNQTTARRRLLDAAVRGRRHARPRGVYCAYQPYLTDGCIYICILCIVYLYTMYCIYLYTMYCIHADVTCISSACPYPVPANNRTPNATPPTTNRMRSSPALRRPRACPARLRTSCCSQDPRLWLTALSSK